MNHWSWNSIFYHIYPLGLCGAAERNDFSLAPQARLDQLYSWLDAIQNLGVNAIYLGPLFESSTHGYDTADYYNVDRRLGTNGTLKRLSEEIHRRGMRLILDGVFNHTGRDFWAFRDVLEKGQASPFTGWFQGLKFGVSNPLGDPFTYDTWQGYYELVKLNLSHPEVKAHLFHAIETWVEEFQIDGLRLDAADQLGIPFIEELSAFCHHLDPDFWLLGEIVVGDYRTYTDHQRLDSTTNYECYKGLYSSHVDGNYFEIAYALKRQFGPHGIYRNLPLYAFADNHDVNRVASNLTDPGHLFPLYLLLFSMPGVPSIYYGSEWGITGKREAHSDTALRPALTLDEARRNAPVPELADAIRRFAALRHQHPALQSGDYHPIFVSSKQFIFERRSEQETMLVAVNAEHHAVEVDWPCGQWVDVLNHQETFQGGKKISLPACWGRICSASQ